MESPAHSPAPARSLRERALQAIRPPRPFGLFALGVALFLLGCGSGVKRRNPAPLTLVAGRRAAPIPPVQLAHATRVARFFAADYARSIYVREPSSLPGATAAVDRELAAASLRVPLVRRGRSPHLAGLEMKVAGPKRVEASITIVDGRSPRFSVGVTVSLQGNRWKVSAISAPE